MKSARAWKSYYAIERDRLGASGLEALLERAPTVELPAGGALVFPHTRLELSGELAAAAALACVRSGRETVLALGVLHGAREADLELVARARAGEPRARAQLRRVHGPEGHASEEFSLDGFAALLGLAAQREGTRAPRLLPRYPFLVGERPDDLPGLDELRALVGGGAALVATADPIHHGVGYGTPLEVQLLTSDPRTHERARDSVARGLELLAAHDFAGFLEHAAREKSDFRDPGPVLATLVGPGRFPRTIERLLLVEYATVLGTPEPTWVAGALVR